MADGVIKSDSSGADVLTTNSDSGVAVSAALESGSAVVQDLLVVYTAASANALGSSTLREHDPVGRAVGEPGVRQ